MHSLKDFIATHQVGDKGVVEGGSVPFTTWDITPVSWVFHHPSYPLKKAIFCRLTTLSPELPVNLRPFIGGL